jgi:hypothetical protein
MSKQDQFQCVWQVRYTPWNNLNELFTGSLFVAMQKIGQDERAYQAILGIIINDQPKERMMIYDQGRRGLQSVSQREDYVVLQDSQTNLMVRFNSVHEATVCAEMIQSFNQGNFEKIIPQENVQMKELSLEQKVINILQDPTFPQFVREVESILGSHPSLLSSFFNHHYK